MITFQITLDANHYFPISANYFDKLLLSCWTALKTTILRLVFNPFKFLKSCCYKQCISNAHLE